LVAPYVRDLSFARAYVRGLHLQVFALTRTGQQVFAPTRGINSKSHPSVRDRIVTSNPSTRDSKCSRMVWTATLNVYSSRSVPITDYCFIGFYVYFDCSMFSLSVLVHLIGGGRPRPDLAREAEVCELVVRTCSGCANKRTCSGWVVRTGRSNKRTCSACIYCLYILLMT
jgi:hypothetical protein